MRPLNVALASVLSAALLAGSALVLASGSGPDAQAASTPARISPQAPIETVTPTRDGEAATTSETDAVSSDTELVGANPVITRVPARQWRQIVKTGTWRPGCPVGRKDLRRLEVGYVDFEGRSQRGVLIAHRDTVGDLAAIFTELYDAGFPIARMRPVERYDGDVVRSLKANNTSAFNCRKPGQINAPVRDSPHANGRAIDINPLQNPWTDPRCGYCWVPSARYANVADGPGVIRKGSLPVRLFKQKGWIWQNIKVPDYMHFDTGYPSRPRPSAASG